MVPEGSNPFGVFSLIHQSQILLIFEKLLTSHYFCINEFMGIKKSKYGKHLFNPNAYIINQQ